MNTAPKTSNADRSANVQRAPRFVERRCTIRHFRPVTFRTRSPRVQNLQRPKMRSCSGPPWGTPVGRVLPGPCHVPCARPDVRAAVHRRFASGVFRLTLRLKTVGCGGPLGFLLKHPSLLHRGGRAALGNASLRFRCVFSSVLAKARFRPSFG